MAVYKLKKAYFEAHKCYGMEREDLNRVVNNYPVYVYSYKHPHELALNTLDEVYAYIKEKPDTYIINIENIQYLMDCDTFNNKYEKV